MKKLITALTVALVLVATLVFAACTPDTTNKLQSIDTAEEFYTYGVASMGTLLSVSETNPADGTDQTVEQPTEQPTTQPEDTTSNRPQDGTGNQHGKDETLTDNVTDEQIELVNQYMGLVEGLLSDSLITSSITDSDLEGYTHKNVVTIKDFNGEAATYTLYYNMIEIIDFDDDDDDDDDDDRFERRKDNEQEQNFRIEGVMIVDETQYTVSGYEKQESEDDESETESMFRVDLGNDDYIVLMRESETETEHGATENEDKFVYSFYKQGKLTERTEVELEQEGNETELEVTVTKDGVKNLLKFEEDTDGSGKKHIKVFADIDGEVVNFKVFVTTDEAGQPVYRYVYGNGTCDRDRDCFR